MVEPTIETTTQLKSHVFFPCQNHLLDTFLSSFSFPFFPFFLFFLLFIFIFFFLHLLFFISFLFLFLFLPLIFFFFLFFPPTSTLTSWRLNRTVHENPLTLVGLRWNRSSRTKLWNGNYENEVLEEGSRILF